jgi:nitrile hydratase beta subunit
MKLQHHLGGLENLGPLNLEKRVFVQEWEKRIFGIHTVMMAESAHLASAIPNYPVASLPTAFRQDWSWASLRTGAEGMQPFEYFKYRYYEKWLMGISQFFVDHGYISPAELASRTDHCRSAPEVSLPDAPNPALKSQIVRYLEQGDSPLKVRATSPRFAVGDSVSVRNPEAVDHSRLPGYLRNKSGRVVEVYPGAYGYFVNTGLDGIGDPMPVYRVSFDGEVLWGRGKGEPDVVVYADLFEAYLA